MAPAFVSSEGIEPTFPGPWDRYNFSPESRTQYPIRIFRTTGNVQNAEGVLEGKSSFIHSIPYLNGHSHAAALYSSITFDFGKEVCGPVTLTAGSHSSKHQTVAFAYAESSQWVGFDSDDATSLRPDVHDGHFSFQLDPEETYTVPMEHQRGGYRFLTVLTKTAEATLEIVGLSAKFTSMPHWKNLRAYPSYFQCNDELLNRLWYAAAYTNQLSVLAKDQGRRCELESGWLNDANISTSGETVITDAPRRDRTVWAGDFAIVIWSQLATINDMESMRNALDTLYDCQSSQGQFPWAGPPICHDSRSDVAKSAEWPYMSDTYHLWTMLIARHYYHITGDLGWLKSKWNAIVRGMEHAMSKFHEAEGLYKTTNILDWGRKPSLGFSLSSNVIFYETLRQLSPLANLLGDQTLAEYWNTTANAIHTNLERFWDPSTDLYMDNLSNSTLHPQDGNSLAVLFGLVDSSRAVQITSALKARWGLYGPVNPECSGPVSPFISGFELQALCRANRISDALSLIRTAWGWMLNNPASTGSTMLEAWGGDGSLVYPFYEHKPSYISHCHPWSTGPVLVLTYEVLGLNFVKEAGTEWEFRPSTGDLEECEGGYTGTKGTYSAGWKKIRKDGVMSLRAWVYTPEGTVGKVKLPVFGTMSTVVLKINQQSRKIVIVDGHVLITECRGGQRYEFKT